MPSRRPSPAHLSVLLAFVATLAAWTMAPAAGAFQTSAAEAASVLAMAAKHERAALRQDKLRAKALKGVKPAARQAKKAKGKKRKKLEKVASSRRAKAKRHARKAAWHRKLAARLRALAARLQPPPQAPQPRAARRAVRVPLGTAVPWTTFQASSSLQNVFLREFDQMTPENELKMFALQPARGQYRFAAADAMVNWALSIGKRVRGHTLIYGSQLPGWVAHGTWTRAELLGVMEDHIKKVMAHFRGRVGEWDVVNEAIAGDGGWSSNVWRDVIGSDYVDKAFQFAREADPSAKLYYNEGGIDLPDHPRTQGTRSLLAGMKGRGIPVDGVGMQNHMTNRYYATASDVAETMRRFAALGLQVAVTEMDVSADGGLPLSDEYQNQATIYAGAAQACRQEPSCTSFTVWGLSDANSWLGAGAAPLLFDTGLNPKPAWYAVTDWLRNP